MTSNIPNSGAVYHLSFTSQANARLKGMPGSVQECASSLANSAIFTLNPSPPLFTTHNTLMPASLQYHLPFNPTAFSYVTNNADSTTFLHHPQNASPNATMSINMLGQVCSEVNEKNKSVSLKGGGNGSGYPLASCGLSLQPQIRQILQHPASRPLTNGNVGSPAVSSSSSGSKLVNFFAQLKCQKTPNKDTPVVHTPSSTAIRQDHPHQTTNYSQQEDSTVRLQDFALTDDKVMKRPRDLLLHIIKGRTVFETATGQMPTAKHNAYIQAYYNCRQEVTDLDQVLAEPDSPDSDEDPISLDLQRVCQRCNARKPSSHFTSLTAAYCDNCTGRPVAATLPPSALPTRISPVSVPYQAPGRGRRRKRISPAVEAHAAPATSAQSSYIVEKVRKSRNKATKERIAEGSSSSGSLVCGPPRPSTSQQVPVDTDDHNWPDLDPDVLRAAPLVLLLRNKPNIQAWKVADVETFLTSVRGMETHMSTFREKKINGKILWKMCGLDDDLPVSKVMAGHITHQFKEMDMLEGMAFKLRHLLKMVATQQEVEQSEKFLCAL